MKAKITNIGNSKGIIIPKTIIEQCGLKERVSLEVKDNCLVISPASNHLRQGWAEAIIAAGGSDNDAECVSRQAPELNSGEPADELLMGDYLDHNWDEEEWTW